MSQEPSQSSAETSNSESPESPAPDSGSPVPPRRPVIKKRRSRKERHEEIAQPDEFTQVGGTVVDWLIERGKLVSIVIGVSFMVLLVGGVKRMFDDSKREDASAALFKARELLPADASNLPLSGGLSFDMPAELSDEERKSQVDAGVKGLEAVTVDFKGTPQAEQARVLAGRALFDVGEYARALVFLEGVSSGGDLAAHRAMELQAHSLMALDRAGEAVAVLSRLRDQTKGAARARASLDLGAAHAAAGDLEAAQGIYTLFEQEFPDSDLLEEAKNRLSAAVSGDEKP